MEYPHDGDHSKKPNKTSSDHNPGNKHHPPPSSSELLSSAKIVANAAKAQFNHDPNYKLNKVEVAGAAENLLNAASRYGKLDEKGGGLGKVVGQAENYLHKYHSNQSSTTTTTSAIGHSTTTTTHTTEETQHSKPHKEEHGGSGGGGYGDYIKMAEGLFNKHSGSGGEGGQSGGKYGDYIKLAEGFLKK